MGARAQTLNLPHLDQLQRLPVVTPQDCRYASSTRHWVGYALCATDLAILYLLRGIVLDKLTQPLTDGEAHTIQHA